MFKYDFYEFHTILDILLKKKKISKEEIAILNLADVLYLHEYNQKKRKLANIYDSFTEEISDSSSFFIPELCENQLEEALFSINKEQGVIIDENISRETTPMYSLGYLALKETSLNDYLFNEELLDKIASYLLENRTLER